MLEKATILNLDTGESMRVLFNPEEYSLRRDVNYSQTAIPGLSAPAIQFVAGNMQTLEMELFVDTYVDQSTGRDARAEADKIVSLMNILPKTHAPPRLEFTWGSLAFTCVLASVSSTYQMFSEDGTPVRMRLQVTFNEYINVTAEARSIKRETVDYTNDHLLAEGESIWSVAYDFYNDARKWRPIALMNRLSDPAELSVGQLLRIPALPFRDPTSGTVFE